eukprot:s6553_g1.t1
MDFNTEHYPPHCTAEDAQTDTAKRVLWYLQCPGFEDAFQLDPRVFECQDRLVAPSPQWSQWPSPSLGEDFESWSPVVLVAKGMLHIDIPLRSSSAEQIP